ncbi:MAG TPA: hypothetical protein VGN79_10635 [Devosia sp.]|jgi:hypothetical protein|nr:hypothetical protein [Devosia sp.]
MRPTRPLALAGLAVLAFAAPAQALTIAARVSGGDIAVRAGPGSGYGVVARIPDGTEIPIDQCTQNDSDSRWGSWGDAGVPLRGANATQWCRIPDYGWVDRSWIVGRGLVNVTPPDFLGPGW